MCGSSQGYLTVLRIITGIVFFAASRSSKVQHPYTSLPQDNQPPVNFTKSQSIVTELFRIEFEPGRFPLHAPFAFLSPLEVQILACAIMGCVQYAGDRYK